MIQGEKRIGIFTRALRNEKSMHYAIGSVLKQTYKNFKLYILVGEKTRDELKQYAEQDSRVVLMEREVDVGFHVYAKEMVEDGNEYISAIDADDWYAETYLEELISFAEKNNTDFTACGNYFVNLQTNQIAERKIQDLVYDKEEIGAQFAKCYMFFRTVWGNLYHASVIREYDIGRLPQRKEYGGYGGDTFFVLNILRHVHRIGIVGQALYFYRMSGSSASYRLLEGRINSDEMLLYYAEELLMELNGVSVQNQLFLWAVYGNALKDTIRLLLNVQISETDRINYLLQLFKKKTISEFLELDGKGILLVFLGKEEDKSFIEIFTETVFLNRLDIIKENTVINQYLELLEIWYPQIKGILTVDEFYVLLSESTLLSNFLRKRYTELHDGILDNLQISANNGEAIALLRRLSENNIHKDALKDEKFVVEYPELIKLLQRKEYDSALQYCVSLIEDSAELIFGEQILDLWVNLAALQENISLFVLGKEIKVEYLFMHGNVNDAEVGFEELVSLGVTDENMEYLNQLLYQ